MATDKKALIAEIEKLKGDPAFGSAQRQHTLNLVVEKLGGAAAPAPEKKPAPAEKPAG